MAPADTLLAKIDAFRARYGLSESQFGRRAANDWKLVQELRDGRELRSSMVQRLRCFMADYDPSEYPSPGRPAADHPRAAA